MFQSNFAVNVGKVPLDVNTGIAFYGTVDGGNVIGHLNTFITGNGTVYRTDFTVYNRILPYTNTTVHGFQAFHFAIASHLNAAVDSPTAAFDDTIIADLDAAVNGFRTAVYGLAVIDGDGLIDAHIAAGKGQPSDY
jgi:hypothetical protein